MKYRFLLFFLVHLSLLSEGSSEKKSTTFHEVIECVKSHPEYDNDSKEEMILYIKSLQNSQDSLAKKNELEKEYSNRFDDILRLTVVH